MITLRKPAEVIVAKDVDDAIRQLKERDGGEFKIEHNSEHWSATRRSEWEHLGFGSYEMCNNMVALRLLKGWDDPYDVVKELREGEGGRLGVVDNVLRRISEEEAQRLKDESENARNRSTLKMFGFIGNDPVAPAGRTPWWKWW